MERAKTEIGVNLTNCVFESCCLTPPAPGLTDDDVVFQSLVNTVQTSDYDGTRRRDRLPQ